MSPRPIQTSIAPRRDPRRDFRDRRFEAFLVETVQREIYDSTITVASGSGYRVKISLPRLRWLERGEAAR